MLLLLPILLLILTALILLTLAWTETYVRFAWLAAMAGALLAWIGVWVWRTGLPLTLTLPPWQIGLPFLEVPTLVADELAWAYSLALIALVLAVILTSPARPGFPAPLPWASMLVLTAMGLLAVLADNPLTLVLAWTALDLAELLTELRAVDGPQLSESVVVSFSARVAGTGLVLWAGVSASAQGAPLDFTAIQPQAGLLLLVAAGLRLGILPLHLPFKSESTLRRDFGTILRLVGAASSLVLLARIPASGVDSSYTWLLLVLSALAALYGGWNWLRARDELIGRPFWIIGLAGLAVAATLRADPLGSIAWGLALVLVGGALFLSSLQQTWLKAALLIGALGLSAVPFSVTAIAWTSPAGYVWSVPLLLPAQVLLMTGLIRHLRAPSESGFADQPSWARMVYPIGILLPLATLLVLGLWGWPGAAQIGVWPAALTAVALTVMLTWLAPRLPMLFPTPAHWVRGERPSRLDNLYRAGWGLYRWLSRLSENILLLLEGDGGVLWTLLFLALFIALFTQGGG